MYVHWQCAHLQALRESLYSITKSSNIFRNLTESINRLGFQIFSIFQHRYWDVPKGFQLRLYFMVFFGVFGHRYSEYFSINTPVGPKVFKLKLYFMYELWHHLKFLCTSVALIFTWFAFALVTVASYPDNYYLHQSHSLAHDSVIYNEVWPNR